MMTPRDFCYWLQGYMEIENPDTMDAKKIQTIKDHLQLVFKKETPDNSKDEILDMFSKPVPIHQHYQDPVLWWNTEVQPSC